MTRVERRAQERHRRRQIIQSAISAASALALTIACVLFLTGGCADEEPVPEATDSPEVVESGYIAPSEELPVYHKPAIDPMEAAKTALAKTVWGEARGCFTTEQAAVVWCVLNRFDSGDPFYAECRTICDIVAQPDQFAGYDPDHPVDPDILALVEDVLARWQAERSCIGDVGRVLPAEYLFFTGDGEENIFTTEWRGGQTWDWSLDSPYEE